MNLADLFVSIGLKGSKEAVDGINKVEGALKNAKSSGDKNNESLDQTEKVLKRTTVESGKVAVALSAISGAFLVLANAAGQAGEALKQFALNTGLGVSEIQRWEYAAQSMGVGANHLKGTILALQKQQAQIALGGGDISGFQFFGINPAEGNPFQVLARVREELRKIGDDQRLIGIARERAASLGISDEVFQFLRLANPELQKQLELTQDEVVALSKMNTAWIQLRLTIAAVGAKFVSALAKPMEAFWKVMKGIIDRFALFVNWLNKGSGAANVIKWVLGAILIIVAGLAVAFTFLTAALALATAAMFALDVAASPVVLVILAIAAALILGIAQILLYIAIWDDLMVALEGGDAVLTPIVNKWKEWAEAIREVGKALGFVRDDKTPTSGIALKQAQQSGKFSDFLKVLVRPLYEEPTDQSIRASINSGSNPVPIGATNTSNSNQTNIEVNVDGSGSPRETGAAVVNSLKQAVSDASFQQPAPAY